MTSDFGLSCRIIFPDECVFHVIGFANAQNNLIWGTEKSKERLENIAPPLKVRVWCAVHVYRMVSPCYNNIDIVRGVEFYKMLNINVQSNAQEFSQNAALLPVRLFFTLKDPFVLYWMKCFQIHSLEDMFKQFG